MRASERFAVARLRTAGFLWVMASVSFTAAPADRLLLFHAPDFAAFLLARISVAEIGLSR